MVLIPYGLATAFPGWHSLDTTGLLVGVAAGEVGQTYRATELAVRPSSLAISRTSGVLVWILPKGSLM